MADAESGESIVFDRAADYYDRTRAISAEARAQMVRTLGAELEGRGTCLEVGVGTGRIALPLRDAGVSLVGADLSVPMLQRLVANAGGARPFPIAVADATRLPFADASFGAAMVVHVLHLIPAWRTAADEMARVVRPGGVLLVNIGGGQGLGADVADAFRRVLGSSAERVGLTDLDALDAHLGLRGRDLPAVVQRVEASPEGIIARYESHQFSWTWAIEAHDLKRAAGEVRQWARDEYGDPGAKRMEEHRYVWRAYDVA